MGLLLLFAILAVLGGYCFRAYRALAGLRRRAAGAWGEVDALLMQRHDELPQLLEACGRHLHGHQETLRRVTRARGSVFEAAVRLDVAAIGAAESLLRSSLGQCLAAADGQPALRTDAPFCRARMRVQQLQDSIAQQRESYNGEASVYNLRLRRWPGAIIADVAGLHDAPLFEFTGV